MLVLRVCLISWSTGRSSKASALIFSVWVSAQPVHFFILFLCSPPSCDGQYGAHLSNLRARVQIFLSYLSSISFFLAVLL